MITLENINIFYLFNLFKKKNNLWKFVVIPKNEFLKFLNRKKILQFMSFSFPFIGIADIGGYRNQNLRVGQYQDIRYGLSPYRTSLVK